MGLVETHEGDCPTLSAERTVKAECLPFSEIPHTTRLFSDFLAHAASVQPFYPRPPRFTEWVKEEASSLHYEGARRARVSAILERQNKAWDASPKTLENIARLRTGASVVVTGQQVGLFGGPLFSIFKALTAVKLAEDATSAGVECIPIFWLATEDHDLAEINHVSIPGAEFSPQLLTTSAHGIPDAPVGTIRLGDEITAVVEEAARLLGESDVTGFLRESYRPGEDPGSAFARLFTRLFADWGLVLLDAADPEFDAIAEPIYRASIERAAELDEALLARGKALESAGYHQQVKVTSSSTLLFALEDGSRVPVHRRANGGGSGTEFLIGDQKISQAGLLRRISETPHNFSPNVLLRPVVQDYLLPTLAYSGGAAEVAYFAQAAVVYQALLEKITPVLPRFSATIVEPKIRAALDNYGLTLTDLFHGPDAVREQLGTHALPQELQSAFDDAAKSLEESLADVRQNLSRLDVTLVEAAARAGSKMRYQMDRLRKRAARAELNQSEVLARRSRQLSNALFPNKTLQEREVAGIYFVSRYGPDLLRQLYQSMDTACIDHQVISL